MRFPPAALLSLILAACAAEPAPPLAPPPPELVAALRSRAPEPCNEATAAALAAHGVTAGEIASVFYVPIITGGGEAARRTGIQAWVQLANRPGSVVVDHNLGCGLRQIYARDGATLPR